MKTLTTLFSLFCLVSLPVAAEAKTGKVITERNPVATIKTTAGNITVKLFPNQAPKTVETSSLLRPARRNGRIRTPAAMRERRSTTARSSTA